MSCIKNRNEFIPYDVGWFCFVSMKQRIDIYILYVYIKLQKNTGHNEVISFDLLWKNIHMHIYILYIYVYE
jgi:hypothetical protein